MGGKDSPSGHRNGESLFNYCGKAGLVTTGEETDDVDDSMGTPSGGQATFDSQDDQSPFGVGILSECPD